MSQESPYMVGDIVVFKLAGRDIPIVHRVLKVHEKCVPPRRYPPVAPWLSPRGSVGTLLNLLCCPGRDDGNVDLLTKGDNNK